MGKATQSKTNPALLIGLVAVLVVAGAVGAYMLISGGQEEPEFVVAPPAPSAQPREATPTAEADEEFDEDEDVGYLEPEEQEEEEAEEPTLTRRQTSERRFAAGLDEDEEEEDEDEPREPRAMDMEDDLAP